MKSIIKRKNRKIRKTKKISKLKKQKGGNDEFGFIITRCVKIKEDNQIWKNCYNSIRKFYKEKILIITDGSNKELIEDIPLENVTLIDSEFPGAAEVLPYYYFNKLKPFKKAVCLLDSMWFTQFYDFNKYDLKDVVFLVHFSQPHVHRYEDKELELAQVVGDDVVNMYHTDNWLPCFGGSSYITLEFLEKLEDKFHFLVFVNYLGKEKIERSYRHSFERIFAVMCYLLSSTIKDKPEPSLFGDSKYMYTTHDLKDLNTYDNIKPNSYLIKLLRGR